jgi:hypothetical protein
MGAVSCQRGSGQPGRVWVQLIADTYNSSGTDVLDLDFNAAEPLGQSVVNGREDDKEDKADDGHDDGHEQVNDANLFDGGIAEQNHRYADECVDEAHQDIHRCHDLAGLQDGDADDLFFHND